MGVEADPNPTRTRIAATDSGKPAQDREIQHEAHRRRHHRPGHRSGGHHPHRPGFGTRRADPGRGRDPAAGRDSRGGRRGYGRAPGGPPLLHRGRPRHPERHRPGQDLRSDSGDPRPRGSAGLGGGGSSAPVQPGLPVIGPPGRSGPRPGSANGGAPPPPPRAGRHQQPGLGQCPDGAERRRGEPGGGPERPSS